VSNAVKFTGDTLVCSQIQRDAAKNIGNEIAEIERKIVDTEAAIEAAITEVLSSSKEEKTLLRNYITALVNTKIALQKRLEDKKRRPNDDKMRWENDVRSVFGPIGTEVPLVIKRNIENSYPFQNRKKELRLLWDTFIITGYIGTKNRRNFYLQ
jgi:hypothetical protein